MSSMFFTKIFRKIFEADSLELDNHSGRRIPTIKKPCGLAQG